VTGAVVDPDLRDAENPVDRVTVQVQGDVVRADHDAVAGTVDQVAVELRVLRDRCAAPDVGGERISDSERARKSDREGGQKSLCCESAHPAGTSLQRGAIVGMLEQKNEDPA
jgi:hypothetical protein